VFDERLRQERRKRGQRGEAFKIIKEQTIGLSVGYRKSNKRVFSGLEENESASSREEDETGSGLVTGDFELLWIPRLIGTEENKVTFRQGNRKPMARLPPGKRRGRKFR